MNIYSIFMDINFLPSILLIFQFLLQKQETTSNRLEITLIRSQGDIKNNCFYKIPSVIIK